MQNCYLCKSFLNDENKSKEHILLNSIGGRLKSSWLLCKTCNSSFGSEADKKLSEQLAFVSNYLRVKRDQGKNPDIKGGTTEDGTEYKLVEGHYPVKTKPTITKTVIGKKINYQIIGEDKEEVQKILDSIKKKASKTNYNLENESVVETERYLDDRDTITFTGNIGGELPFRSITKSAVNYFIYVKNSTKHVEHILPYLKGLESADFSFHYNTEKPPYDLKENEVLHILHLVGDKEKGLLYCYIEFFSAYPFITLLNDKYIGDNFTSTYCYDILQNKEVNKLVNVDITLERLSSSYILTREELESLNAKLSRLLSIGNKIHLRIEYENIFRKGFEKILRDHPNERNITNQMKQEFSDYTSQKLNQLLNRSTKGSK